MNQRRNALASLSYRIMLMAVFAGLLSTVSVSAQTPPPTYPVKLRVESARTEPRAFGGAGVARGDVVPTYKYIINIDNTGQTTQRTPSDGCSPTSPGYPAGCNWTSIAGVPGSSPIQTQGIQDDFATDLLLPAGRYLISVLADGYKLDGRHFRVPLDPTGFPGGVVTVELQPHPLPTATIQAAVFEDITPVNSAPDLPAEHGLAGWEGHLTDYIDFVTTDVFGNPLCTEYERDSAGNLILDPPDYAPTPIAGSGGRCVSKCYVVNNAVEIGTVAPIDSAGRCPTATAAGTTLEGTPIAAGLTVEGKLIIPNLGTNRYALSAVPPNGTNWVQTTTLEGNHDWDAWVMEGATGLDTEFVVAGEPFPAVFFGFVPGTPAQLPGSPSLSGSGAIKGVVSAVKVYVPTTGGLALPGGIWGGMAGAKIDKPVAYPWLTLSDLNNGDTAVWVGQGGSDGSFTISNVPAGTYSLTWWDEPQDTILDLINVTVGPGETVDMGVLPLTGWWTTFEGYVFNDLNRNGKKDPGEPGIANFPVSLKKRENSLMDRGTISVTTDAAGHYFMESAYPMTQWLVMEVYADLFYTTGVTYQADNQPTETTLLGAGVDVSVLPIIGLSGRMDWGVHAYDPTGATCTPRGSYDNCLDPRNGGIVGTVSYDTTRNELDPRYAAVENWQPGISNLNVNLYKPVACGTNAGTPCDATGRYELVVVGPSAGAFAKGQLLNQYLTETWQRPTGCLARDVNGNELLYPRDQLVLPALGNQQDTSKECLEGPLMGVQFAGYPDLSDPLHPNFGAAVDGNYGFGDGCFGAGGFDPGTGGCADGTAPTPLVAGDYLVEVEIPNDASGKPLYQVTKEEDINIFNGDQFVPQIPPPECAGALHTVDVAGSGIDNYPATTLANGVTIGASLPVDNPPFADAAGTVFEGQVKPLCDTKLVHVSNGRSIAPTFNLFTEVPIPGRFWGLIVDDLNFSSDPKSLLYGEKAGVPFAPVGIYDYTNRLVTTVESDFNGLFDVLLPSSNRISCPTPSGVCANLYRFVGNDPGIPGRLNPNYRPEFRTIAAEFEAFPGLLVPADLAPTQMGVTVQLPGGQTNQVSCALENPTPQLFALSQPYAVRPTGAATVAVTLNGLGFGAAKGNGQVFLDNAALATTAWSDTRIVFSITSTTAYGPHQLKITSANGRSTVNGLTFHVVAGGTGTVNYNPRIFEVGPGKTFSTIQSGIDAAEAAPQNRGTLVVVYPGTPDLTNPRNNPRGAYYENVVIHSPLKLQGVGPGGFQGATFVPGSIIDGGAFGGDTQLATDWRTRVGGLTWVGNQTVYEGQVIYVLARSTTQFGSTFRGAIDGLDIRGGNEVGFPTNINEIGGTPTGLPPNVISQAGAIFVNAYARYLQITNNVVQNNSGGYGTIRIGTPNLAAPETDQQNDNVRIAYNRIIANAGTNLAGGIGIFAGSENYEISGNDICGNFSAEYGGGISQYGYSPNGSIHDNRIYFNKSYDEGGGVIIAGELPANPTALSPGSGPVDIYNNLIQANLGNDDGGGLRFLMAGNFPINVYNNIIVNNVSTHEGGGVSLNDSPKVRIFNNTIMKNITTATAVTSNGLPAPAGLSSSRNSSQLQATLPAGSPLFSNPVLFNNIFWDNRAGTRAGSGVTGIGALGDATPLNNWDLGVADGAADLLAPTNTLLQTTTGTSPSATNIVGVDPQVVAPYDTSVAFAPWRNNPAFVGAILVALDLPPNLAGDYHLSNGSPAVNAGAASKAVPSYQQPPANLPAPTIDVDNQSRPAQGGFDIGADEIPTQTDLSITKTDGLTSVAPGGTVSYTIVVSNAGPTPANGATVTDLVPAALTGVTWNCTNCAVPTSGSGNINSKAIPSLPSGGTATFIVNGTVVAGAVGTLVNSATVSTPSGITDSNPANNTATDTDSITAPPAPVLPALALLDSFNRANANNLGGNWSQVTLLGLAVIRVNGNQAFDTLLPGAAYWNSPAGGFGARQGAAFTFSVAPLNGSSVILKATGGVASLPANFIRVSYQSGQVVVSTTTTSGLTSTMRSSFAASLAVGDRLSAVALDNGTVNVFKTTGTITTFLGGVNIPTSGAGAWTQGTGGGRIGIQLPANARVDNFSGGNTP